MAKRSIDMDQIKQLAILHGEKAVFGLFVGVMVLLFAVGFKQESYLRTAEDLRKEVNSRRAAIESQVPSENTEFKQTFAVTPYQQRVRNERTMQEGARLPPPVKPYGQQGEKRGQPEILPAVELNAVGKVVVVGKRGVVDVAAADPNGASTPISTGPSSDGPSADGSGTEPAVPSVAPSLQRLVVVTARIPRKEQRRLFEQEFKNTIGPPSGTTDVPRYVTFQVERKVDDGPWQPVPMYAHLQRYYSEMAIQSSDIVDSHYVWPLRLKPEQGSWEGFTMPLPFIYTESWGREATTAAIRPKPPGPRRVRLAALLGGVWNAEPIQVEQGADVLQGAAWPKDLALQSDAAAAQLMLVGDAAGVRITSTAGLKLDRAPYEVQDDGDGQIPLCKDPNIVDRHAPFDIILRRYTGMLDAWADWYELYHFEDEERTACKRTVVIYLHGQEAPEQAVIFHHMLRRTMQQQQQPVNPFGTPAAGPFGSGVAGAGTPAQKPPMGTTPTPPPTGPMPPPRGANPYAGVARPADPYSAPPSTDEPIDGSEQSSSDAAGTSYASNETYETPILLRFIDYDIEFGRKYQYRVQLALHNPNYQLPPQYLKREEFKDQPFVLSPWSEPTPAASVSASLSDVLAGPVKPARGPVKSSVRIIAEQRDRQTGGPVRFDLDAERGQPLDFVVKKDSKGNGCVYRAPDGSIRRPDEYRFETGWIVLDFRGGPLGLTTRVQEPGEVLLVNSDGQLQVRLHDEDTYKQAIDELAAIRGAGKPPAEPGSDTTDGGSTSPFGDFQP
jgi:hypothetical protein